MLATFFVSFTLASLAAAKVQYLGINIAGGDFGCQIDGTCPTGSTQIPLSTLGGGDGSGQMKHFVQDDGMNMFRLPISWQFLTNNQETGTLDPTNSGKYDQLVQACLATGAYCMIDMHNFARWNGAIIGQGGPTDDQFVALWTSLATKYSSESKVVFELMNEPHDLDINLWAATCQKVVTGIRNAGATSQMILLPGTNFDSAATLVSTGSAAALMGVKNPDGTTDNLLLDIHKYLDTDNSGTHATCTTDNTAAFNTVATYLRSVGRQAIVSETGASSDSTCLTDFCAQNAFINANSDVFVGLVAWAAGSFSTSYLLSLTPTKSGSSYVDNTLLKQCVLGTWQNSTAVVPSASASPTPTAPATTGATEVLPTATSLPSTLITASASGTTSKSKTATTVTSTNSTSGATDAQATSTGSSTMKLTLTGTATADEPTTLVTATGMPSSFSMSYVYATSTGSGNATKTAASASSTVVVTSGQTRLRAAPWWLAVCAGVGFALGW